jgi:hypothetical protein
MARNIPASKRGFGYDSSLGVLSIYCNGSRKMDFGTTALATEGAATAALLLGNGTSTTPASTSTAGKNFLGFWTESEATSGDSRGLYLRHYIAGVGGSGEAARIYGTVSDVAATDARGAHISLSFGSTGTVTSSGQALTTTLHIPNTTPLTGTLSCITAEIYSEGSTSDPAGASLSFIRFAVNGDTTGDDDVITDAYVFDFSNLGGSASGSLWYDNTAGVVDEFIKVKTASGTRYLLLADDVS